MIKHIDTKMEQHHDWIKGTIMSMIENNTEAIDQPDIFI